MGVRLEFDALAGVATGGEAPDPVEEVGRGLDDGLDEDRLVGTFCDGSFSGGIFGVEAGSV